VRRIIRTTVVLGVTASLSLAAWPTALAAPDPGPDAVADPTTTDAPDRSGFDALPPAGSDAATAATDHVLVRFAPTAGARQRTATLSAEGVTAGDPVTGTGFVEVPVGDADPTALVAALQDDPTVAEVQLDHVRSAARWTDDPLTEYAWPYLDLLRLPRAWDQATGTDRVIAVLDTGVDAQHEDLAGRLVPGYDVVNGDADPADDQGHGTAVAGVAAGIGDNGRGSVGAAFGAKVMPVKVLDAAGDGYDSQIATGITWAATHDADVINLSLGGPDPSPVIRAAIADAVAGGAVVVASSGNGGSEAPNYPAAYAPEIDGLLSVGATDDSGSVTEFSSWGDSVTVAAPGFQIIAPGAGGGYVAASGTSFSAPLVSGVAALLARPARTPASVESAIVSTARDAGPRGRDPYYGAGVVDAAAALDLGTSTPLERAAGDGGADDTATGTVALALATPTRAALTPEGDQDWYAVTAAEAGWFSVTVTPSDPSWPTTRPRVTVLAADGEVLASAQAVDTGDTLRLPVPVPVAGVLRVGVSNVGGAVGDAYTLDVRRAAVPPAAPLAGTGSDAWVVGSSVRPHQAGVDGRPTFTVPVGRDLAPDAVSATTVRLVDAASGLAVDAARGYDGATRTIALTPSADLTPGRHYQLWVGGLTDADGAVQAEPFRVPFTAGADGSRFTPVTPWRVLDTRNGTGGFGPVRPGAPLHVEIGGAVVPPDATAVVLNVTAVNPGGTGNVRVYPTPAGAGTPPTVSNLNVVPGTDQPNLVTVALGSGGQVSFATDGTTAHLLADVAGYYREGGATGYEPVDPVRVMDTRDGTGGVAKGQVRAGRWVDLVVRGRAGVPADASAVVLNVTAVQPTGKTNVRVYPAPAASEDQSPPVVSNLNVYGGRDQPNLVTVAVGDGGRVRFYTQTAGLNLVADLAGYYAPSGSHGYVPLTPTRIADTRSALGITGGALQPGVPAALTVAGRAGVPADAAAAVLNVTAVRPDRLSNLRIYPASAGGAVPLVSNLNVVAGRDEPNLVIARLGTGGAVSVFSQTARTGVVVDVAGYFRR